MNGNQGIFQRLFRFFMFIFFGMSVFLGTIMVLFMLSVGILGAAFSGKTVPQELAAKDDMRYIEGKKNSHNQILSIPVNGVIMGSKGIDFSDPSGFMDLGVVYGYEIAAQLKEAAEKPDIKAVFMEYNTPGGTIYGSQAIFDGMKLFQEKTKKPIFVHVQGLSASGGVWSMVGADKIYADYGSMVGSIGILGPTLQFFDKPVAISGSIFTSGIETVNGIETRMITAGRSKDLGNPFRRPTDEEIEVLERGTRAEYENFVRHVSAARKIEPDFIKQQLGALIFDNGDAEKFKLIDGTRSRSAALDELAKTAGVEADYKVVRKGSPKSDLLALLSLLSGEEMESRLNLKFQKIKADKCSLASYHALAYFGNTAELCR